MINQKVIDQIKQSEYWNDKSSENDNYLGNLTCPECGEHEAYAYKDNPYVVRCNRRNNCGSTINLKEKLPDPLTNIEEDYPPTVDDPHAPATAYLKFRGLGKILEGLVYEYRPNIRNTGSGGILFLIQLPDGNTAYNGRIFNPPKNTGKSHNEGSIGGGYWKHPGIKYKPEEPTYVTEGIINAMSLIVTGLQAIAVLSSGKDPTEVDLSQFEIIVLAFDNDKAGKEATRRWSDYLEKTTGDLPRAILPDTGDWNDFLLSVPEENITTAFEEKLSGFEINANLARAKNGFDYAELLFQKKHYTGLFEFKGRYWFSWRGKTKDFYATDVSNFTLKTLRFQKKKTSSDSQEYTYYLEAKSDIGKINVFTATAQELSTPNQMRTVFMQHANVHWKGDNAATNAILGRILESQAPEVMSLEVTGYDRKSGCYIYKTHMINETGDLIMPDENGLFKISHNEYILPAPHETICPSTQANVLDIVNLVFEAWGDRARVAIAWLVAALYVNQIKDKIGFFPFLSFTLGTQTGKTYLAKTMNAFQCLDEEGLPMSKSNTSKGENRKMAQRAGLFIGMLEWPTEEYKARFDLNQILTMYNKGSLQVRALKTNDLQIMEVFYLGALLFVQNKEPFKTKAQKERVISLAFKNEELNDKTRAAYNKLEMIPIPEKAAFYPYIMAHREWIEQNWDEYYKSAQDTLSGLDLSYRILEIHALVLGFHNMVSRIFGTSYDLVPYISEIATIKQKACLEYQETLADVFFEVFLQCDADAIAQCSKVEGQYVYINIPGAEKVLKDNNYNTSGDTLALHESLRSHPAFIRSNKLTSIYNVKKKAWVFDAAKMAQVSSEVER